MRCTARTSSSANSRAMTRDRTDSTVASYASIASSIERAALARFAPSRAACKQPLRISWISRTATWSAAPPLRSRCLADSVAVACSNGCSVLRSASAEWRSTMPRSDTAMDWPSASAWSVALLRARALAPNKSQSTGMPRASRVALLTSSSPAGICGKCGSRPVGSSIHAGRVASSPPFFLAFRRRSIALARLVFFRAAALDLCTIEDVP
mmetsp:Transcript_12681/g.50939  ORF Transcript_12681/g.50939 Transcript_12681/m.50939 type:complete len:210 (+) Transcript_12681:3113-3742(+)